MIRYHIELADDPGGEQAAALAQAVDGTVVSTVRCFNGLNDLAIIDVAKDESDDFAALLAFEVFESETVVGWRMSLPV